MLTLERINSDIVDLKNHTSMLINQMHQECLRERQILRTISIYSRGGGLSTQLKKELITTRRRASALNAQIMQNNRKIEQLRLRFFEVKGKRLASRKLDLSERYRLYNTNPM